MKKYIQAIITLFLILFLSVPCFSADTGTLVVTSDELSQHPITQKWYRYVSLTATHSAAPALSVLLDNDKKGLIKGKIAGWKIHEVWTYKGGTVPTDATDIFMNAVVGNITADLLGNNGVDMVDSTTVCRFVPYATGTAKTVVIPPAGFTITTTGNAVASAVVYIVLVLE